VRMPRLQHTIGRRRVFGPIGKRITSVLVEGNEG
jgi:hypothetical protein